MTETLVWSGVAYVRIWQPMPGVGGMLQLQWVCVLNHNPILPR